jgi:hypothetical protein
MVSAYSIVQPRRRDAVKAYTSPGTIRRRAFPKVRHDNQGIIDVRQSIWLTLMYLSANIRPYDGGRLVSHEDDHDTVIWPLLMHTSQQRRGDGNGNTFVDVIDTRYFFDADGQLLRQVHIHPVGSAERPAGKREVISTDDLDPELHRRLLEKLERRRFDCLESWKAPLKR